MDEDNLKELQTEEIEEVQDEEEIEEVQDEIETEVEEKSEEEKRAEEIAAFIESAEEDETPKELKPMDITPIEREPIGILITDEKKKKKTPKEKAKNKIKNLENIKLSKKTEPKEEITYSEEHIDFVPVGARIKSEGTYEELEIWNLDDSNNIELSPEEMYRPEIDQRLEKKQNMRKDKKKKNSRKKVAIIVPIVVVLVAFLTFVGISLFQTKKSVDGLKDNAQNFLSAVQSKDTQKSEEYFKELRTATKKMEKVLDGPFFKVISIIPKVKKEVSVANELVDMVDDAEDNLLEPLIDTMKIYPLTELKVGDGFNTELMNAYLDFLEEKQPYLEEMLSKLDKIDSDSLIGGYIGSKKEKIYELVDSYHEAIKLLPLLRTIIGDGEDRLYILAAQNSAEIRASGGFPGSMGTIRIENGVLTIGDFKSVYKTLNGHLSYDAGLDFEDKLFGEDWLYAPRDSCFIPDFSKAARVWATAYRDLRWEKRYEFREKEKEEALKREQAKAKAEAEGTEYIEEELTASDCVPDEFFYDRDYYMAKFHVDGVISMTPAIIQMMLEDVGEIELSDGTKLNSTNATKVLQYDLYMDYFTLGNDIYASGAKSDALFAETAKKAMKEFVGNFEVSKFSYYYKLFRTGIDQHIINIWMEDPDEQEIVEEAGAGGRLSYDENDPFTGIYFSLADPCKLGWYIDIIPEIGEPIDNPDGSKTYDVTVELTNTLTYEEAEDFSWYIIGNYSGTMFGYIHFLAPAGGSISNIYTDSYLPMSRSTYHGLEMAFNHDLYLDPQETIMVHYQITTAPGVTTPLRAVTTPTLTAYRD